MLRPLPSLPDAGDELALVDRVRRGDRGAFETIYHRFHRPLGAYLLRLTGRPEAVDELVDDTLLVVWRGAARFDGRSRLSTWIFGIAYRKALKHFERQRREASHLGVAEGEPVCAADAPDRRHARRELAQQVVAALDRLPAEQRSVVMLTYYQGLSYPEIAAVMDCPLGTVKTRMFHARRKLARLLAAAGLALGGEDRDEP
jgi:RNA polymerase sigma-70 factor (ECF subfamily)